MEIKTTHLNNRRNFGSGDSQRERGEIGRGRFTDDVEDANTKHRGAGSLIPQRQVDPCTWSYLQLCSIPTGD